MFSEYFSEYEVKSDFLKEFISLWDEWLGQDEMYKLDQVTEQEWLKFHNFIILLSENYQIGEDGIRQIKYEETEHYEITKSFLNNPEPMLRELFRHDDT